MILFIKKNKKIKAECKNTVTSSYINMHYNRLNSIPVLINIKTRNFKINWIDRKLLK